jgi:hypothetical protein
VAPERLAPAVLAGPPWREAVLVLGLLILGLPLALLVFGLPLAALAAVLDRRRLRVVPALAAAGLAALIILRLPEYRFLAVATALSLVALLYALLFLPRVGYAEVSVCVLLGVIAAVAAWLVYDPRFFVEILAELERMWIEQSREWLRQMGDARALDAASRLRIEQVVEDSARISARTWPTGVFVALWIGSGAALAFATGWARGAPELTRAIRVRERCALFRLPDLWIWPFLAGVVGFVALPHLAPEAQAPRDAALNLALVAAGLYAWQGLAVTLYFLERRGVGLLARVLLLGAGLALLTLPFLVLVLAVGLADAKLDLRSRGATREPRDGTGL